MTEYVLWFWRWAMLAFVVGIYYELRVKHD